MTINRTNSLGMQYILHTAVEDKTKTVIKLVHPGEHAKVFMVPYSLEDINQAWYNWQMRGWKIQQAFHFMSPDEREFLLTGLLPSEWEELWKGTDE